MSNWLVEIGRYAAEGETGARYIIVAYREDREQGPSWDGRNMLAGVNVYRLDDGRELQFMGKGEFEVVETGEVIWTVA